MTEFPAFGVKAKAQTASHEHCGQKYNSAGFFVIEPSIGVVAMERSQEYSYYHHTED
jgi:hypothetical protein